MLYTVFIFASNFNDSLINSNVNNLNNCLEIDNNFKIKEANNLQKEKLHKISLSIEPVFKIISYFLDPFVIDCCYIFVENLQSKEIKHHTIFFNDTIQSEEITQNILFEEEFINESFKSCIFNKNHIDDDYKKFYNLFIPSYDINFYTLVKTLIFDFDCILYKTNYKLAHLFQHQPKNTRYSNYDTLDIHKKVCNFMFMCVNLRNKKLQLQCLTLENKEYLFLKIKIENVFLKKINFFKKFLDLSLSKKTSILCISTNSIYQTLRNSKILPSDLIRFTFNKIKSIKNKLNQYSLLLCFCSLYNRQHGNKNILKIIRLMTYIWIFFDKLKFEKIDSESLNLLHNISKSNKIRDLPKNIFKDMTFLYKSHINSFKILIMKQYLIFSSNCNSKIFSTLDYLISNQTSFEYTWLIFRCCIYTKIIIFNF